MPPPVEPNFTKGACAGSLDVVVIPVISVFPEFPLVSAQRRPKTTESEISLKNGRFAPQNLGGPIFMRVHHQRITLQRGLFVKIW